MTQNEFDRMNDALYERKVRELHAQLRDLVEAGAITDAEANEWALMKQEQWKGEGF